MMYTLRGPIILRPTHIKIAKGCKVGTASVFKGHAASCGRMVQVEAAQLLDRSYV